MKDGMERIHVAVRARPLSAEDAKTSPWRISGYSIFIPNTSSKFEFDRIFAEDSNTVDVYEALTKDIVSTAVGGFNGTVFAYGQTNSGKTHTMRGSLEEPGVIPLAVRDLFNIIHQNADREFLLRMSYMEIYNEEINDLLAPEHRKLQIHESLERGIYVAGLREEIVAYPEQVLDLMEFGESHRHIGETNMNLHSSRSHTIFRMIIESRDKTEDEDVGNCCDAVRVSVLNLVDLAGSERAAKTGAEGVRLKEGSHINKSLMTLGTVIKKLSEGAESQGGHVPYRDSKLTRILQPALGGNANTAIICNITLAQIHTDETKSSLQFASRALRVTNCAHVNEILTDAALLKRQKKEIEELRSKLQGSHSEHLGEEILNLRNTLLQTELERERIALELVEEKKAQAEREKMVQEQAKKIETLSSMVLYSNRDENRDRFKKEKRRDTWCPGNLSRETLGEAYSTIQSSAIKPTRYKSDLGPLLPFEELVNETDITEDESFKQDEDCINEASEEYGPADPCALLHVTNRRKVPLKKISDNEFTTLQAEYEDLLIRFESQRTESEIQIDYLTRKLVEADLVSDLKNEDHITRYVNADATNKDRNCALRESEAILVIKRLQEQIRMLEMQNSSSQQNLDSIADLAMEQNICARQRIGELQRELVDVRKEVKVAHEQQTSIESEADYDSAKKLLKEVPEITSVVENSKIVVESIFPILDEAFQSFAVITAMFLDFKTLMCQSSLQVKSLISDSKTFNTCMMHKVNELENEKHVLYNQSIDLQKQIEELRQNAQNSEQALRQLMEEIDSGKEEYISHVQTLEREISSLSASSLVREKEALRKDLEKTKMKLKDTEFKLRSAMQEKTKLEGEKATAEREIKRLHGQNSLLERDINKHELLAGRRRDSVIERGLKMSDPKRDKGPAVSFDQTLQEEYKMIEVYAFEMETKIASLEEELSTVSKEKEEALFKNEDLVSKFEDLYEKLNVSNSELDFLREEALNLRKTVEESKFDQQKMESSIKALVEEKEELEMRLTDSLLEIEEEKAVWSAKEKASIEAIKEKVKLYNAEIASLSKELSEIFYTTFANMIELSLHLHRVFGLYIRNQLESSREDCKTLEEKSFHDQICNGKNIAKLRMRLRWTQARTDAFLVRYMEAVDDLNRMNKEYEEATTKLKDRIASMAIEILNLKKTLS